MTEIEKQGLALINAVGSERNIISNFGTINRQTYCYDEAFCRAIERHEAFKQEVSDAVRQFERELDGGAGDFTPLRHFIIPKPVDPLVEALREAYGGAAPEFVGAFREALAARNLEIVEKKP